LVKELTELQTKQTSYLFDGKTLTLFDVSPNTITVLAYENGYYLKKENNFYSLSIAKEPKKYTKVNDNALKEKLEKILYVNGKFE